MFKQTKRKPAYPSFSVDIKFCGHDLTVRGTYFPGEAPSSDSPGEAKWMEFDAMFIGEYQDCVAEVLEPSFKEIEALVWEALEEV